MQAGYHPGGGGRSLDRFLTPHCLFLMLLPFPRWLVDPQDEELARVIGDRSYNELVQLMVGGPSCDGEVAMSMASHSPAVTSLDEARIRVCHSGLSFARVFGSFKHGSPARRRGFLWPFGKSMETQVRDSGVLWTTSNPLNGVCLPKFCNTGVGVGCPGCGA